MTGNRKREVTAIKLVLMSIFIGLCFFLVLIHSQEAYAEMKKVSGTYELTTKLHDNKTFYGQTIVRLANDCFKYSSSDPDWDNATTFNVRYYINPTGGGNDYKGCTAITHPNGDQTFFMFDGSWKLVSVADLLWTASYKGSFTGGTGKFKGIKGAITFKGKGEGHWIHTGEWEVVYDIIK